MEGDHAARLEARLVHRHGFARDEVRRDRVRRERVDDDEIVRPHRCGLQPKSSVNGRRPHGHAGPGPRVGQVGEVLRIFRDLDD